MPRVKSTKKNLRNAAGFLVFDPAIGKAADERYALNESALCFERPALWHGALL